jgi:hypothetical protein
LKGGKCRRVRRGRGRGGSLGLWCWDWLWHLSWRKSRVIRGDNDESKSQLEGVSGFYFSFL